MGVVSGVLSFIGFIVQRHKSIIQIRHFCMTQYTGLLGTDQWVRITDITLEWHYQSVTQPASSTLAASDITVLEVNHHHKQKPTLTTRTSLVEICVVIYTPPESQHQMSQVCHIQGQFRLGIYKNGLKQPKETAQKAHKEQKIYISTVLDVLSVNNQG